MFCFSIIKKKTNKTGEMKVIFACFKVSNRMNVSLFHIDYSTLFIKTKDVVASQTICLFVIIHRILLNISAKEQVNIFIIQGFYDVIIWQKDRFLLTLDIGIK